MATLEEILALAKERDKARQKEKYNNMQTGIRYTDGSKLSSQFVVPKKTGTVSTPTAIGGMGVQTQKPLSTVPTQTTTGTPFVPSNRQADVKPTKTTRTVQTPRGEKTVINNDRIKYADTTTEGIGQAMRDNAGARFIAGYYEGLSPVSMQDAIGQKYGQDTQEALQNSKAYAGGQMAGVATQFAIPYAGAAPKIGTALSGVSKFANMGKVGQGITKSVATDLAVGLPLNVNYALNKEGLRGTDALKSIGINTAIDLVAGGLIEVVPSAVKGMQKLVNKQTGETVAEVADEVAESVATGAKRLNPTSKALKKENVSFPDLPVRYNPNLKPEARNLTDHIEVGDKFKKLSKDYQDSILIHENAHNISNDYLFKKGKFSDILNNKAFGESKTANDGRVYWEGIFGDVGATSVDETFTEAISVYMRNPEWLMEMHPDVYRFIETKVLKSNQTFKGNPQVIPTPTKVADEVVEAIPKQADTTTPTTNNKNVESFPYNKYGDEIKQGGDYESYKVTTDKGEYVVQLHKYDAGGYGERVQVRISTPNNWKSSSLGESSFSNAESANKYVDLFIDYSEGRITEDDLIRLYNDIDKPQTPVQASNRPAEPRNVDLGTTGQNEQMFAEKGDFQNGVIPPTKADKVASDEKIAEVLVGSEQAPSSFKKAIGDSVDFLKRKFVDSGDTVSKIAKITNDRLLYPLYNNAKQAIRRGEYMIGEAQTDITGNQVGKSLKDILDPIRKKGDGYYKDFQTYLYHMHNVDRMNLIENARRQLNEFELANPNLVNATEQELRALAQNAEGGGQLAQEYLQLINRFNDAKNKPVFGDSVTSAISTQKANELLQQYPEFAGLADDIYKYNQNLLQYRVDGGLISQADADMFRQMYPHYVPTFRTQPKVKGINLTGTGANVEKTINSATGSNLDLIPLHESMSKQTMQVTNAASKNLFGNRLIDNATGETAQFIQDAKRVDDMFDPDANIDEIPTLKNYFKVYRDGVAYQVKVDDTLFEGIEALTDKSKDWHSLIKLAQKGNVGFKELITGWNPFFLVKNGARDIQDVGLFSKDLSEFAKQYPVAFKEMTQNGQLWRQYKALGGTGSSFFDYAKGYKDDPNWFKAGILDNVEKLNMSVEQLPRFTEFIATVRKGDGSYDNLIEALYNAADATVNFGRSGTWGKTLNSTFVPFFNPSIQGTSRMIRRFTETKGAKEWTELVLKISALGVAPSVINDMLYWNDEQYQMINDRDRDINFLFKVGDGEFVKIPKGRVLSLFGSAAQRATRVIKGETDAFAGWIDVMSNQVAPISITESNIISPIKAVSTNTSWFGSDIEPTRLQKYSPGQRYDEKTTSFAKALGGALNYSPKKIDYLVDAYSGVIGDIAIPLTTPSNERNLFEKSFILDSNASNKLSSDFYDKMDDVYYAKNDSENADENDIMYRYLNKQSDVIAELNAKIREIDGSDKTPAQKESEIKEIRALINATEKTALDTIDKVEAQTIRLQKIYKDQDDLYREVNKAVFGSEYALKTWNRQVYEKAASYSYKKEWFDAYYKAYFDTKDIRSDKDTNGNSIVAGSKAEKSGVGKSASLKKKETIDKIKGLTDEDRKNLYDAFDVSSKVL